MLPEIYFNTMKVSIITVTYNSEKYLQDCINSILSQHHPDIEHIIVDGGSTDNTLAIIKSYGNKILIGSMGAGNSGHFTGPHELLHVLTDAKHGDFQTEFDDGKMLWHTPGSSTDTIDATKRVSKNQGDKILLNTLAQ